jgi:hypothetical protein
LIAGNHLQNIISLLSDCSPREQQQHLRVLPTEYDEITLDFGKSGVGTHCHGCHFHIIVRSPHTKNRKYKFEINYTKYTPRFISYGMLFIS